MVRADAGIVRRQRPLLRGVRRGATPTPRQPAAGLRACAADRDRGTSARCLTCRYQPTVTSVSPRSYTVPTDQPEADGTLAWDSTTVVTAEVTAGGTLGLGWTYASASVADRHRGRAPPMPSAVSERARRAGGPRGDGAGLSEPGTSRRRQLGHLRRRHRAVGLQGHAHLGVSLADLFGRCTR